MAGIIHYEPSRTLMEFRLLPRLTTPDTEVDRVSLETNLVWGPEVGIPSESQIEALVEQELQQTSPSTQSLR